MATGRTHNAQHALSPSWPSRRLKLAWRSLKARRSSAGLVHLVASCLRKMAGPEGRGTTQTGRKLSTSAWLANDQPLHSVCQRSHREGTAVLVRGGRHGLVSRPCQRRPASVRADDESVRNSGASSFFKKPCSTIKACSCKTSTAPEPIA